MVDYYSILLRAVTAPGAGGAQWRRGIYDRSRRMLAGKMRSLRPQPPLAKIAAEEAALEAAIERVESELSWTERDTTAGEPAAEEFSEAPVENESDAPLSLGLSKAAWVTAAVVIAALGAGSYLVFSSKGQQAPPPVRLQAQATVTANAPKSSTPNTAAPKPSATPPPALKLGKNGELAPGVDGGASDPDQQYVFRRQPTFYRTLQPVGTVIVDKGQHFLYLIQPNNVAIRYGIAVGDDCADLAGMRHVATMAEWPIWQPPPGAFDRNPTPMPGGPGNPLGARVLQLDDGRSRINGTNAPKTIGNAVTFGCIRLTNEDVADLYARVKQATPVVVN